jgi:SAM-dependent methyltransferase
VTEGLAEIRSAGWELPEDVWTCMSAYERTFALSELTGRRTRAYYDERIRWLGLDGLDVVLDAGCGIGQWSVALAAANGRVEAVDIDTGRLLVAGRMHEAMGVENVTIRNAPLERLPLPAASVDGIFCYGVFMFANMPQALAEFARVLRPGGRLYLNANATGWYVYSLVKRPGSRRGIARMLVRTALRREAQVLVRERWLRAALAANGFDVRMLGAEGTTTFRSPPDGPPPPAAYDASFAGLRLIHEVAAVRLTTPPGAGAPAP